MSSGSGASKPAGGRPQGEVRAISWRDRAAGGVLVLVVLAAQTHWMGPVIVFLSGGLVVAYVAWAASPWKFDAASVLPVYLIAIAVQCLHFTEEYVTGFQHRFPALFGADWSDAQFVSFNLLWLAAFILAGLGVYRGVRLGYLVVLFFGLIGGVGNGISHIVLSAASWRYFPGLITAPFCLLMGVLLLARLFGNAGFRAGRW